MKALLYIKKDIPVLILRLFPNKHKMDGDGEWKSPVYILTFNPKPCFGELSMASNTVDCFPRPHFPVFWLFSLLVKTIQDRLVFHERAHILLKI